MVKRARFPPRVPYLVAAIGDAHGGRIATARRLVALAAAAGADAVACAIDNSAAARDLGPGGWREVRREARGRLAFVAAPRDRRAFEFAQRLSPDAYQIDPPAMGDLDLLRRIGRERRPVLLVAGSCTTSSIRAALRAVGRAPVTIMHTIAAPAVPASRTRLQLVPWLSARFRKPIGYVSSEAGTSWALVSAALGATVIEKPLVIDRSLATKTCAGAVDPEEFGVLARSLRAAPQALAPVRDRRVFSEEMPGLERDARSLVARRRLHRGHTMKAADVESSPSAGGLSPRLSGWLIGRRLRYGVEAGEPITFGVVDVE